MHRRLAAILTARVVDYDRLTGTGETAIPERVRQLREELIVPVVAAHEGRIVQHTGGRLMAEFVNAVEALRCAVEVQRALGRSGTDRKAAAPLQLRMAVNLGDVYTEGGRLRGDGVEIGERIEDLARPGGLCITRTVLGQVRGQVDVAFEDLGAVEIEAIAQTVYVFEVLLDASAARRQAAPPKQTPWHRQWATLALGLALIAFLISGGLWLFARAPVIEPLPPPPSPPSDAPPPDNS